MTWFHLTIKKGKRKKRAHKKWMKKTGVWAWLKEAERRLQMDPKLLYEQETLTKTYEEVAIYGYSEIELRGETGIWTNFIGRK